MFGAKLMVMLAPALISVSQTAAATADPAPTWVVDPRAAGESRPTVGRSLFDFLFTVKERGKRIYRIPFPFEALAEEIDARLPRVGLGSSRLNRVLIPLGRSLQRNAAAPSFFQYPRVVVAVDTEPLALDGNTNSPLKDRLYLGYQEKANIIEVISYNDEAGRFEFQVVRDYGPGLKPVVFYANRRLCMGCHQNGGPIFPAELWDETDSNPKVAEQLLRQRREFYGAPVSLSFVPAIAIGASIDRANLFSAHQLLWREGCASQQDSGLAIRCRASVFTLILQYRLSGYWHFDKQSSRYRDDFLAVLTRNWQQRWPEGLAVPNPEIPNRDPFRTGNRVSSEFDPLNPRPPLEVWSLSRPRDVNRVITGLAEHLATADVQKLDQYLFTRGVRSKAPQKRYNARCKFVGENLADWLYRLWFTCRQSSNALDQGFDMDGWIYIEKNGRVRGMSNWLNIGKEAATLRDLELINDGFERRDGQWLLKLQLVQNASRLHARLPHGGSVVALQFRWPDAGPAQGLPPQVPKHGVFVVDAALTVMDDFAPVHTAVAEIARQVKLGRADVFSSKPFRRIHIMQALFKQFGLTRTGWCCQNAANMPPIRVEGNGGGAQELKFDPAASAMHSLFRVCGTCHQTANRFPPNFLGGDTRQITSNLKHCAQRIFYRLSMWDLPMHKRPKSPMPPANALVSIGIEPTRWRQSNELARLQRYVADLLISEGGKTLRPQDLLSRDYETMRVCLPGAG